MALRGTQYTVTAAAARPFPPGTSGLNTQIQEISFKAPTGNAGTVYIGNSNVTTAANALIELPAGSGFTSGPFDNGPVNAEDYYVVGTANDKLYIYFVPR